MRARSCTKFLLLAAVLLTVPRPVLAQSGFDDPRVMLQGFYWESYRHGNPRFPQYGKKKWYDIVRENAGIFNKGTSP